MGCVILDAVSRVFYSARLRMVVVRLVLDALGVGSIDFWRDVVYDTQENRGGACGRHSFGGFVGIYSR